MSKILVCGGAGFIGYHLVKRLAKDKRNKIWVLDNFERGGNDKEFKSLPKNVKHINKDILENTEIILCSSLVMPFDEVYHLAAINGTKNFYERPCDVLNVNVIGTINILNWFVASKSKKLLFTSSSETYAGTKDKKIPTPEDVPLTIEDVTNPRWSYAGSKIIGELFCLNYAKKYKKQISVIRYHNIYGPRMGNDHVIPEFCKRIKENPFKIYGGTETRAFCYVDDAVEATIKVMRSKKTNGKIIHIGNDKEEIPIITLAKKMCQIAKKNPKFKILPAPKGSTKRRCPDITKLRKLGFEPNINLESGLKKTMQWYGVKIK